MTPTPEGRRVPDPINTLTASGADETVKDTVKRSADERGTRRWIAWSKDDLAMFRDLVNAGYQKGVSQVEATHAEALATATREEAREALIRFRDYRWADENASNCVEWRALESFMDREYPATQPVSPPEPTLADLVEECRATQSGDGVPFQRAVVAALDAIGAALATQVGAR